MDKEKREQIEKGIESARRMENQLRNWRFKLQTALVKDDISHIAEALKKYGKEVSGEKYMATVHDINEARQATKQ